MPTSPRAANDGISGKRRAVEDAGPYGTSIEPDAFAGRADRVVRPYEILSYLVRIPFF